MSKLKYQNLGVSQWYLPSMCENVGSVCVCVSDNSHPHTPKM